MKTNILVTGLVLATVGDGADLSHDAQQRGGARTARRAPSSRPIAHEKRRSRVRARHDGQHGRAHPRGEGEDLVDREHARAGAAGARDLDGPRRVSRSRRRLRHAESSICNRDLDSMYAKLMDFAADGGGDGPEAVNEALDAAIHRMSWSQDQSAYKVVFLVGDAPPHMDYQDDVKYPQIVAAAAAKGIVVNTIQCGTHERHGRAVAAHRGARARALLHRRASRQRRRDRDAVRRADRDACRGARRHAPLLRLARAAQARWRRKSTRRQRLQRRGFRHRAARGAARSTSAPAAPPTSWASTSSSTTSRAAASISPPFPPAELPAAVAALPRRRASERARGNGAEARGDCSEQIAALAAERDAYIEGKSRRPAAPTRRSTSRSMTRCASKPRRSASSTRAGRAFEPNGRGRARRLDGPLARIGARVDERIGRE